MENDFEGQVGDREENSHQEEENEKVEKEGDEKFSEVDEYCEFCPRVGRVFEKKTYNKIHLRQNSL